MYLKDNDELVSLKKFREIYLVTQETMFNYNYVYARTDISFDLKLEKDGDFMVLTVAVNREGEIRTFIINERNYNEMTKQYGLMLLYIF